MINKTLILTFSISAISTLSFASDSFEAIAGFRLGQECSGSSFTKKQISVRNPDDVLDTIIVSRNLYESLTAEGYLVSVVCGIIDNTIIRVALTSKNPEDILQIQASLREKMGRAPDDKKNVSSKAQRTFGLTMDGNSFESEYWSLSGGRRAASYTSITRPFGARSLSDFKWSGGIDLSYADAGKAEWQYLKSRGIQSSRQKEVEDGKQRKDSLKSLLE